MRYGVGHKEESRSRILSAAARQFRASGTVAVSVADVMQAVGMTHGGFYKHFSDKDQLLQEAVATALAEVSDRIREMTRGMPRDEALRTVIEYYLSEGHVKRPDLGCALAALGTEIARLPLAMRKSVAGALDAYALELEYLMPGETRAGRLKAFRILFSSMAGCVMAARSHVNHSQRQEMLIASRSFFTKAFCGDLAPALLGDLA